MCIYKHPLLICKIYPPPNLICTNMQNMQKICRICTCPVGTNNKIDVMCKLKIALVLSGLTQNNSKITNYIDIKQFQRL